MTGLSLKLLGEFALRDGSGVELSLPQYQNMRAYEKRVLADQAHFVPAFWWYKINVQRTYMKGWNIAPSHYLNQHLDQVWIDPKLR